jgi:hypothetical protein
MILCIEKIYYLMHIKRTKLNIQDYLCKAFVKSLFKMYKDGELVTTHKYQEKNLSKMTSK